MATLAQIREELERNVEAVASRIGVGLIQDLSSSTIRDTGYHASRWVGRNGGPPASRATPKTRNARLASVSFAQQSSSVAALRRFRIQQRQIVVANDGDFINALNARGGNFVSRSVNEVVRGVSLVGTTLRR